MSCQSTPNITTSLLKPLTSAKIASIYTENHRRRLLILAGGAETRNEKQLHTNFSKLSVIRTQFGSLINDVLYPIH